MKQKNNRKLIIIILLLIIFFTIINILKNQDKIVTKEDFIFFKIFNQTKDSKSITNSNNTIPKESILKNLNSKKINYSNLSKEETEYKKYIVDISYKNMDFKNINLSETIDNKTLVNEKIAPGTKGEFEIIIKSNQKLKYQVKFESKNEKPQNLIFYIKDTNKKYSRLEDMEKDLKGEILNKEKTIHINWEWEYSTNIKNDKQDTQDGISMKKYNFNIYTIGEE